MPVAIADRSISGGEWQTTFKDREPFWVQKNVRGVWHVETPDDPERMLCGEVIRVDDPHSKVQTRPGLKECPWCEHELERVTG